MLRDSLVFVAAVCFIAACLGDPVPDMAQAVLTNSYYITTWDLIGHGADHRPVENSAAGVEALNYLDGTQTVAFVVHGRGGSAFSEFAYTLRDVLSQADQRSAVIVVDWSAVAASSYDHARALVPQVAQDLSNFIALMEAGQRLNRNLLHLIGFDLGAHVVGNASRNAVSRAMKITALSPAGEGWGPDSGGLQRTDAQFVEVIHTDAVGNRAFGMVATGLVRGVGTLDFFPNGATRQPGCSFFDNACYHNRAWQLFAATVQMGGHLLGNRCDTLEQALNNRCIALGMAVMGSNQLVKISQGIYRVNTGRVWPYSP
uniref:Pancreatic lipase-like protein n=1 Tax=Epiphyas postvittana TaxID=65032 RepID=F5GTG0_EPIPO